MYAIGIDIGGANIKVVATAPYESSQTFAFSVPFPLWREADRLATELQSVLKRCEEWFRSLRNTLVDETVTVNGNRAVDESPMQIQLFVTMTGELADCYETRQQGVCHIVDATSDANKLFQSQLESHVNSHTWSIEPLFYSLHDPENRFVDITVAKTNWNSVAAANWHALAVHAGSLVPDCLMIDIGSTSTDIIPIKGGIPCPIGKTDLSRLENDELIYVGIKRSPVCSIVNSFVDGEIKIPIARELFATIADAEVVIGNLPELATRDTADGRTATRENSLQRLARMVCSDREELGDEKLSSFARQIHVAVKNLICGAIRTQLERYALTQFVVSGEGEFLAREAIESIAKPSRSWKVTSLSDVLGQADSICGPAYALTQLGYQFSKQHPCR